jgi:phosphatidylserine decarboxylase
MKCVDREGCEIVKNDTQDKALAFLYQTRIGRGMLSVLIKPRISIVAGKFLDSSTSRWIIGPFMKKSGIDLSEYEMSDYRSFNEFFTRKIKPECRKIDWEKTHLIAPCDSKLSVYPISQGSRFVIKDTEYSMESLLRSRKLAKHYEGGQLLVFRLAVDDYHRYCYVDDGLKSKNYRIPGVFHTVNPLANDVYPIYKENTREFSILKSQNFGRILMMEVGALLVGRIVNYHERKEVKRGEEKGRFEFGGSTVILCLEKNRAVIDEDILLNSSRGIETIVKMGEKIGVSR